ncbi:MAG: ATP-binding protein [Saprospiraceae bacterium]
MRFSQNIGFTFSLLILCSGLSAQQYLFDARMLRPEDGLANLMTTSLYKDKKGFIWTGTGYGLNRYDGYGFRLFTRENNHLQYNADIQWIREDAGGKLWLFYRNGVYIVPEPSRLNGIDIFDPKTRQAVPFEQYAAGKAPFSLSDICLTRIIDPKNRLWIHTNKGELFLSTNEGFKKVFQRKGVFFQYITIDREEHRWMGWQDSLMLVAPSGDILEKLSLPGHIHGIWSGDDQNVWLATQEEGSRQIRLWHKPKDGAILPFYLVRDGKPLSLEKQRLPPFVYRNRKGFWFCVIRDELHVFDERGNWLHNFSATLNKNMGDNFHDYIEDGARLWLASSTGIATLSARENPFRLIFQKDKIFSDSRSITEDDKGNLYFLNSSVFQWNRQTNAIRALSRPVGAYAFLYLDSTVWVSTYGVRPMGYEIDLRTRKEISYEPLREDKFFVNHMVKTGTPGKYLAGMDNGLAYLDLKAKKLLHFDGYPPGNETAALVERSPVNYIHQNNAGVWLATKNGIFLLNEKEGVLRHYHKENGALPFNHIRHIYEDKDGGFWLATKGGGVIRWQVPFPEGRKSSYRQFTTDDGLADNFTYAVYEDDYGKLWIPSDKGLMQMDKTTFRIRTFTTADGLPHNEFNAASHYKGKDGTLYFGGLGGLIAFHPRVFAEEDAFSAPMAFIRYFVQEEDADKMTDKTQWLRDNNAVRIEPGDKFFELHFALLDFEQNNRHRYAYQIEGYSDNWNYIDENYIRITHLPYGDFRLRIRGQNSSRGWSAQELSLDIRVVRPFYLRWWFIALLALLTGGAILAAVQWRITALKKGKERLEAEVRNRTRQLEEQYRQIEADRQIITAQAEALHELDKAKTRFFSNITHEFRTPLTLITGPLEQVASEQSLPTIFRRRLTGVLKNAHRLLALINQLLDLSKIEGGHMKTEATRGDVVAYTKDLVGRFQPLAQEKGQHLYFFSPLDCWETIFDRDKWDKILYNLLSNAVKFTPAGQTIQASLQKTQKNGKEYIRLDVKDSGIGIEKEYLPQIFNRFYQVDGDSTRTRGGTGIGLALVKELVELQDGEIRVSSEVNKGTSFEIYLPTLEHAQAHELSTERQPAPFVPPAIYDEKPGNAAPVSDAPENLKLELLLIEDNAEIREYIRYCIDPARYNITEAADGEEGIQKAQALIPDLIISDVMMPKKDGFEVAQAIRSHIGTSHIPLILLTARASLESRLEGIQRGADAYLTKPFSPQELALRIQKLIEIRHLLQQRYTGGIQDAGDDLFQQEDEFVTGLRAYIFEHLDESDLDGDRIGRHFGLSRVSLYRKLNALTGQSISDFVRATRLSKALQLIREGHLNLSEIAYQTGFSSISAFSRAFKQAYGKSPSEMKNTV